MGQIPIDIKLEREDIILLILEANERLLGSACLSGITRLEKLLFLLIRESGFEGIGTFFEFKAHHFGPFSKEVYEAVEFLDGCGLVEVSERSYPSYFARIGEEELLEETAESPPEDQGGTNLSGVTEKQFTLTENGRKVAKVWRTALASKRTKDLDAVDDIVRRFGNMPLNQLIAYVYRRHPDMTVKSIHPLARTGR